MGVILRLSKNRLVNRVDRRKHSFPVKIWSTIRFDHKHVAWEWGITTEAHDYHHNAFSKFQKFTWFSFKKTKTHVHRAKNLSNKMSNKKKHFFPFMWLFFSVGFRFYWLLSNCVDIGFFCVYKSGVLTKTSLPSSSSPKPNGQFAWPRLWRISTTQRTRAQRQYVFCAVHTHGRWKII